MTPYPLSFLRAVAQVLRDEGVRYVNNPADPGGATKFGISSREYPDLDIAKLTDSQATEIYYRDWWLKFRFADLDQVAASQVAAKVFDLAVNIGPEHAVKCLQRAIRACGRAAAEDGIIGPATARAAIELERAWGIAQARTPPGYQIVSPLLAAIRSEAAGYYRALAAVERGRRPNADHEFLTGWLNRAYA